MVSRFPVFFLVSTVAALAACERIPNMADTEGPDITLTMLPGHGSNPVRVMSTNDESAEEIVLPLCADGTAGSQTENLSVVIPAGRRSSLFLVNFNDPSGIASAEYSVSVRAAGLTGSGVFRDTRARHDGGTAEFYLWEYQDEDNAAPYLSPIATSFTVAPAPRLLNGAPFVFSATDGSGNTRAKVFFIGHDSSFCD